LFILAEYFIFLQLTKPSAIISRIYMFTASTSYSRRRIIMANVIFIAKFALMPSSRKFLTNRPIRGDYFIFSFQKSINFIFIIINALIFALLIIFVCRNK